MVDIVNKIEFSYQKFQSYGTIRDESYDEEFLFTMKYFLSFVTDHQFFLMQIYS